MTPPRLARFGLLLLAGWLLGLAPLPAAEGGFTATLSAEQKTGAGITLLTPDERTALDQFVADDLGFARRENLTALDESFVARRTAADRKLAGLDRLTPDQLAKLNVLIASAIAARPQPRERPRLKERDVISAKRKPEVHGSVSVAYGWGSGGRDFRTSSLWLNYYDPESRLGIGVGISTFDGDGFHGYYPYSRYYPGYYYDDPFYSPRMFLDAAYPLDGFGSYYDDDGTYFRRGGPFPGRGFRRH